MTESSVTTVTQFSLGQELPETRCSSSDDLEEEPVTKRIKIDESNDTGAPSPSPSTITTPNPQLDFDLLIKDDSCGPGVPLLTTDPLNSLNNNESNNVNHVINTNQTQNAKVPSHHEDESGSEGGEQSSNEDRTSSNVTNNGEANNVSGSKGKSAAKKGKGTVGKSSRKRRKSKLEPKKDIDDVSKEDSSSDDDDDEDEEEEEEEGGEKKSSKKKSKKKSKPSYLRKNIREILTTNQLDEETLAAQREEQERRARVQQKLQQQQQQNLVQMLSAATPNHHFHSQQIDRLFARKGVLPAPGLIPLNSSKAAAAMTPTVIDEVTLSSDDDENPDIIPLDGPPRKDLFADISGPEFQNGFPGFRSSGGTMHHFGDRKSIGLGGDDGKTAGAEENDSDSDDCIVLSPSAYQEDIEKEGKEDENNVPDEFGRVMVNLAHPPEDPDIFLAPQIARAVKPHQIGGIRFLYDNVVESLERFDTSNGFGCILAHSMGLGKTIQAVSFCDILLRHTRARSVLIIVPINTIQNWVNEFDFWVPPNEAVMNSESKLKLERKGKGRQPTAASLKKNKPLSKSTSGVDSPSQLLQPKLEQPLNPDQFPTQSNDAIPPPETAEENSRNTNSDESNNAPASNSSSAEYQARNFQVFVLNETVKTLGAREKIIADWSTQGGVLLLGYEMYRMLALKRLKRSSKKKMANLTLNDGLDMGRAEEQSLERIYEYLVRPGPDLVICDEGHRIKNSGASISQALKAVRTRRRVVLTGYPLQNNMMEYWCMVDFVRPNYLGSKTEFSNMFERPITNGQCADSSMSDRKLMRYRSHVLHTLLEGFVQRRSHQVLQSELPFKEEWVFLLKMTPIQYTLYKEFIRYLREEHRDKNADKDGSPTANPIKAFAVCCKIWNHPDALYNVVKKHEDILDDLDVDDFDGTEEGTKKRKPRKNNNSKSVSNVSTPIATPDFDFNGFSSDLFGLGVASAANIPTTVGQTGMTSSNPDGRSISLDWATAVFKNYEPELLENGVKFQLLFAILEESQKVGDKLLVFSQSLLTLDLIELFLAKKFGWRKNSQYFRLDGSTSGLDREKLIYDFNDNENVFVFLVSTRAGSLGINLIGANRVVVFDASWNPCHDAQAVCRVYRYGQKKECQIYRFVTDCSLEKRIYDRQINKRGMSDRVVDEMNPETHMQSKDVTSFLVLDQTQMDEAQTNDVHHKFDMSKFTDPVLKTVLERCGNRLTREPFEHESLLIDRKESKLSAKEKRIARLNYEEEKKQSGSSYTRPSYAQFYPKTIDNSNMGLSSSSSSYPNNFASSFNNFNNYNNPDSGMMMNHSSMSYRDKMAELHQIQHKRMEQKSDLPYDMLKERGIDVRFMNLKKDAYLHDPQTGRETFLRAGEKISILRSPQGTYLRIGSNGSLIGIKPSSVNGNTYRGIPLVGDVTTQQLQALVYSLLRPAKSSSSFYNPYTDPNNSRNQALELTPYFNRRLPYDLNKPPPTMQKLPPTSGLFPSFHNHQITNFRSSSGGDVTVLKSNQGKNVPATSKYSQRSSNNDSNNSNNNSSDVEVIDFDDHFGENNLKKVPEKVPSIYSGSRVGSSPSSSRQSPSYSDSLSRSRLSSSGPPTPDISIVPIPASPSNKSSFLSHLDTPGEVRQKSRSAATNNSSLLKSGSGSNDNSNSNSNLSWHSSGSDVSGNHVSSSNINNPSGGEVDSPEIMLWNSPTGNPGVTPKPPGSSPINAANINSALPGVFEEALPAWGNSTKPKSSHRGNSSSSSSSARSFLDSQLQQQSQKTVTSSGKSPSVYDYNPRIAMQNLVRNFGAPGSTGKLGITPADLVRNDAQFPSNADIFGHFFNEAAVNNVSSSSSKSLPRNPSAPPLSFDDFLGAGAGNNGVNPINQLSGSQNNIMNVSSNTSDSLNLLMNPGQYYGSSGQSEFNNSGTINNSSTNNSSSNSNNFNLFNTD